MQSTEFMEPYVFLCALGPNSLSIFCLRPPMAFGSPGPASLAACLLAQVGLVAVCSSLFGSSPSPPAAPPAPALDFSCPASAPPPYAGYAAWQVAVSFCLGLSSGAGALGFVALYLVWIWGGLAALAGGLRWALFSTSPEVTEDVALYDGAGLDEAGAGHGGAAALGSAGARVAQEEW